MSSMSEFIPLAPQEITPATSAYTRHFQWIVKSIVQDRPEFKSLLSEEELLLGQKILSLSPAATLLYAKLLTRQSQTFFSSEFIRERFLQSLRILESEVKDACRELFANGLICFPLDGKIENVDAISLMQLLSKPLLVRLSKRVGGKANLGASSKPMIMRKVLELTKSQKTLFGGEIKLGTHLKYVLKDYQTLLRRDTKNNCHDAIVQLSSTPRTFCRRLYNLFYMTSVTTEELPIAFHNSGTENRKLFDDSANTTSDGQKNNSLLRMKSKASLEIRNAVSRPLPNHGLMVMFGKRKYFPYRCNLTKAVFPTRRDLLNFEHALSFQEEIIAAYTDVSCVNSEAVEIECIDPRTKFNELPKVVNDKKTVENVSVDNSVVCAFGADVARTLKDCINYDHPMDTQCLDSFSKLEFGSCLGCKILEASAKLRKCTPPAPGYPKHLYRFLDGSIFTRIVWEGVSYFEKHGLHFIAVFLLLQLLNGPYSSRRRGKWWIRLLVDANHIKWSTDCIYELSIKARNDPLLYKHGGDMIDIEKRSLRLFNNLRKHSSNNLRSMANSKAEPSATLSNDTTNISENSKIVMEHGNASKSFLDMLPKENLWVITDKALNRETGYKSRFIGFDSTIGCSVEELALQHFGLNEGGWTGSHCEGSFVKTLFALLMWDVIFDDTIPNVFATPFQRAPLDFGTEYFAQIRKDALNRKLNEIANSTRQKIVKDVFGTWCSQFGTDCIISWNRVDIETLAVVAGCIGGKFLANLFRVLASNYRHWGGGMPDLLLWRIHNREKSIWVAKDLKDTNAIDEGFSLGNTIQKIEPNFAMISTTEITHTFETDRHQKILDCFAINSDDPIKCDILFIEVKGPRDRLDGRQMAWLNKLISFGIPAGVCRIKEPKKVSSKLKTKPDIPVPNDDSIVKTCNPSDQASLPQRTGVANIKRRRRGRKPKSSSKKWKKIDQQAIIMQDETDFE